MRFVRFYYYKTTNCTTLCGAVHYYLWCSAVMLFCGWLWCGFCSLCNLVNTNNKTANCTVLCDAVHYYLWYSTVMLFCGWLWCDFCNLCDLVNIPNCRYWCKVGKINKYFKDISLENIIWNFFHRKRKNNFFGKILLYHEVWTNVNQVQDFSKLTRLVIFLY